MRDSNKEHGTEGSNENNLTRRHVMGATGGFVVAGLAGCSGNPAQSDGNKSESGGSGNDTGNNTDDGSSKPSSISLWNTYGAKKSAERKSAEWIWQTAQSYKQETDIAVEVQGNPDRLTEKVLAAYKAGNAPDMVFDYKFDQYIKPGRVDDSPLHKIDDYVQDLKKETYDIIWPKVTFNGNVYGVPQTVNARNWFYNEGLVEKAGYDPKNLTVDTQGKLEQLIKDITDQTDAKGWIWPGGATSYNWYFPDHFMRSWFGTELTEPIVKLSDGTKGQYTKLRDDHTNTEINAGEVVDVKVRANSKEMVTVVNWMKRMVDEGYVPKKVLSSDNNTCLTSIFPNQEVGLYFSGPWAYSLFDEHVSDFKWDVFGSVTKANMNGLSGPGYFTATAGKPLMILDSTKSPDACGEFIKHWYSKEAQKKYVQSVGSLSIRPELNTKENFSIPQLAALSEIVKDATFFSPPAIPADIDLWNTVGGVVQRIVSGKKDTKPALNDLQSVLDDRYKEGLSGN